MADKYLVPVVFPGKSGFPALAAVLVAGVSVTLVSAADVADRAGTAEFQHLETLISARPAGLAGAYTSLSQGEDAIGYNPAGLSKLESIRSIAATLRYHTVEVTSGSFAYAFPGATGTRYAVSAAYVNYGRIDGLDENGEATGVSHSPKSFNPALTASRKLTDRVRVGATLKGITESLGSFEGARTGLGWGVDAGVLYQPAARNLGFGASLLNLGNKIAPQIEGGETGGLLPVSVKGGFFYYPLELPKGRVAMDVEVPWHDVPRVAGGLEYAYSNALVLRAGTRVTLPEVKYYALKASDQRPGDFDGGSALKATGGLTFQTEGVGLDYATQFWLGLGWVHAITLRYAVM